MKTPFKNEVKTINKNAINKKPNIIFDMDNVLADFHISKPLEEQLKVMMI